MEKVINLLYDIEEKANRIMNRTNDQKVRMHNELERQLEEMDRQTKETTLRKLDTLKDENGQKLKAETADLEKDCTDKLQRLENYFSENHDHLVDEVINRIIRE